MAPNFDADALVIVPDPKTFVFDPKMLKMGRNQKSENLGGRRHGRSPLNMMGTTGIMFAPIRAAKIEGDDDGVHAA